MKLSLLAILLLAFVACSTVSVPVKTEPVELKPEPAHTSPAPAPTVSKMELMYGQSLFEKNCNGCHDLPNPVKYDEAKWRKILPDMAGRAKIDDATQNLILGYVVTTTNNGKK